MKNVFKTAAQSFACACAGGTDFYRQNAADLLQ